MTISKIYWLYIPIAIMAIQIGLELSLPHEILAPLHSEGGPHELLHFLLMVFSALAALRLLVMKQVRENIYLFIWTLIAFFASIYVAGEEMSWGQHILEWESSEYWRALNDQGETNLHNTSSWLDQKPRLVLELGVIVGGVIMPLLRRFKPSALPERFKIIYPTNHVIPTAVIMLAVTIIDKIDDQLEGISIFERASEVEELYMFYFVLLYLIALRQKILTKA